MHAAVIKSAEIDRSRPLERLGLCLAPFLLLAVLALLSACGAEGPALDARGDDVPEVTVRGAELEERFTHDDGVYISPPIALESGANRVALMASLVEGAAPPALRVRGSDDGEAGAWHDAEWTFAELGQLAGVGFLDGVYQSVQIAVATEDAASFVELTFSPAYTDESDEGDIDLGPGSEQQELRAELAYVGVKPRSAWGARAPRCSTREGDYYRMALHHTAARATGNVELALRQAQAYHMDGRGYCDIAYHYAVAQDGRIFELRPQQFRGGHTRNNNTGNVGIVFVGCFDAACGNDQPTEALLNAGAGIVAMQHLLEGIAIDSNRVRGHRDHSGQSTACPGGTLHPRLETIRARARALVSGPPPPPPPPPPTGCGIAGPGTSLAPGQSLTSCDGRITLAHQQDGNVVLYQGSTALWSSGTHGQATGAFVVQGDGNVVLYSPWSSPLWSTGTNGRTNAWLTVQNDGNLVVYQGSTPIWASGTQASAPPPAPAPPPPAPAPAASSSCGLAAPGTSLAPGASVTSCDGRFTFVHQGDGNVVLYQGQQALWSTGTHGRATRQLVMQGDGNLVLYASSGAALWHSGTDGHPNSRLAVQDDGNVVVYSAAGAALWNTGTHGH